MSYSWRNIDEDEALDVGCPVCHVEPGQWCVYVGKVARAGYETKRLHVERAHHLWLNRPHPINATTKPHAALALLREWDRKEDRALRDWLRRYVHLLLELDGDR